MIALFDPWPWKAKDRPVKHLLLIVVALALVYGLWNMANPMQRSQWTRLVARHGLRFGALLAVALALLALAYYTPSINIL